MQNSSVFPSDFARLRRDAQLAVYVDLKSPYAYIAIQPTRDLGERLGIEIDWRPFTLDIPSYLGRAKLAKDGKTVASAQRTPQQWSGVKYAYRDARRYAALTDRTIRGTVKIWDSSLAGIAMLWAKRHGGFDRFIDEAYPPFWRRELDIDDIAVLEETLARADLPTPDFRDWASSEGRRLHDRINEEAFDAGVYGVPTYLVEDEMWFGREHLPRIEWILEGREGKAPEVANRGFGRGAPSKPRRGAVTVALDIRNPFSYLALRPAFDLAEETEIELDCLPIRAHTLVEPSTPAPNDDRGARHRRSRARMIAREIAIYSEVQGVEIDSPYRDGPADAMHEAWLWLRDRQTSDLRRFLEEAFRAYWAAELDPSSVEEIAALLDRLGLDHEGFRQWAETEGPDAVRSAAARLAESGISQAPAYQVEDEIFYGRQHLPMIRWILGGRAGDPPI